MGALGSKFKVTGDYPASGAGDGPSNKAAMSIRGMRGVFVKACSVSICGMQGVFVGGCSMLRGMMPDSRSKREPHGSVRRFGDLG